MYSISFSVDYSNLAEDYTKLVGATGFLLIAIVFLTFRGIFMVDKEAMQIIKETKVMGFLLSRDVVKVPVNVTRVLIHEKTKKGLGYIQAAVGFTYMLKSSDIYFSSEGGLVKVISTDQERAIKIAHLLKDALNLNYMIQKDKDKH